MRDIPIPIASFDRSFHFIGHSKLWQEEFGPSHNDVIGAPLKAVMPDLAHVLEPIMQKALKGKTIISEGKKVTLPHGETRWYNWRMFPWKNHEEKVGAVVVVLEDVTKYHHIETILTSAQKVARIGGWEVNLKTNTVYWTAMTKEIHEVAPDYIPNLEEGINFYKPGRDREQIALLVSEAIQNGTPWDTELQIITAKGKELWVRARGEAEFVNGQCLRLYGTFQDIDTKKRSDLAYQKQSERLAVATNAAKIGIWDYDMTKNELIWDDNMYDLYGVDKAKFSGVVEAWEASVHEDDKERSQQELESAIAGEQEFSTEFRVVWPDGQIRHIRAEAAVKRDADGNPLRMIGANWDTTFEKEAEEKLKELLDTTNKQNDSLLNFAYIVSHNLRSHSTNLSMLTDLLSKESVDENQKIEVLGMLKVASGALSETIEHLNEVVQVRTSTAEPFEEINLHNTINNVKNNIGGLMIEGKVSCDIRVSKKQKVLGIQAYLDSILLNMFTNAIKYKHPDRDPHLILTSRVENDHVVLDFKDNGLGIDLERHGSKIFGMFKTFHRHKDAKGIGLFITKNQMEAMQGDITVQSEVNVGTTFSLIFKNPKN